MAGKTMRVKSGIPGLDEMIEGGFVKGHATLVCGSFGTGKSTFCMQFLAAGAKAGEAGLYITFEEDPEQLVEEGDAYGWDVSGLIKQNKLRVIKVAPQELINLVEAGFGQISGIMKTLDVKRIVVDSIALFDLLGKDDYERKRYVLDFVNWVKKHGCTAIITMDSVPGVETMPESGIAESAADGIIALYHPQENKKRTRALEVLKMRETCHANDLVEFEINKKGIVIKGGEKVCEKE
jgi:circadian clock protein KaiC